MRAQRYIILACFLSMTAFAEEKKNHDPYEPYNRVMFSINDKLDQAIFKPVAKGYQKATPSMVRTGVSNFFNNLRDVVSFGSNILRLDIEKASADFIRIGMNTTFGLGGLLNIADLARVPNNKSTLGDTFASWGWKNSHYFVMPLAGPSTLRDGLGQTAMMFYNPELAVFNNGRYYYGAQTLKTVNIRAGLLSLTESLDEAALDKYAYTRDIFMSVRAKQTGASYGEPDDIDIDDLVPSDESASEVQSATQDELNKAPEPTTTIVLPIASEPQSEQASEVGIIETVEPIQ